MHNAFIVRAMHKHLGKKYMALFLKVSKFVARGYVICNSLEHILQ